MRARLTAVSIAITLGWLLPAKASVLPPDAAIDMTRHLPPPPVARAQRRYARSTPGSEPTSPRPATRVRSSNSKPDLFAQLMSEAVHADDSGDWQKALQMYYFLAHRFPHDWRGPQAAAWLLYRQGQDEESKRHCLEGLRRQPTAVGHILMANLLLDGGNQKSALEELLCAQQLDSANVEVNRLLAQLYGEAGERKLCLQYLLKVLEREPGNGHAAAMASACFDADGNRKQALEVCTNALRFNGGSACLYTQQGVLFFKDNDLAHARDCFKQARDLDPHDPMPFELLCAIAAAQQDWDSAADYAESCLKLDPDNPNVRLLLDWCRFMNGENREARTDLSELASKLSSPAPSIHNSLGLMLADARHYPEAKAEFDEAAKEGSGQLAACLNLVSLDLLSGRTAIALQSADDLLKRFPGNKQVMALTAWVQLAAGQPDSARKLSDEVLASDRMNPLSLLIKSRLLAAAGNNEQAIALLKRCMQATLPTAFINCEMGRLMLASGKPSQAVQYAQTALQLAPLDLDAKQLMAQALGKQGNWQAAVFFLREVSGRQPRNFAAKLQLAEAFEKAGDLDGAESAYHAAARLDPRSPAPLSGLARVAAANHQTRQARLWTRRALKVVRKRL